MTMSVWHVVPKPDGAQYQLLPSPIIHQFWERLLLGDRPKSPNQFS